MTKLLLRLALGIWIVLSAALWASDWKPSVGLLGGLVLGVVALTAVVVDMAKRARGVAWPDPLREAVPKTRDDDRTAALLKDMYWSAWADSTTMRETLLELLDDKLLATHEIDRSADPTAADTILTARLRRLVKAPSRRLARITELRAIVSDIEAL